MTCDQLTTTTAPSDDGPQCLIDLITEIDTARIALGWSRWSALAPYCEGDPKCCDEGALWRLLERLSIILADRETL